MKNTKIIATLGPSVDNKETLIKLYEAGINIIRFNFSHANYKDSEKTLKIIKDLNKKEVTNFSFLLDTKGPEIRTGNLKKDIIYKTSDEFKIFINPENLGKKDLYCDYKYLIDDLNLGDIIRIDSGLFDTKVISIEKKYIKVKALNSAKIGSRRHINLPGIKLKLPGITSQDKKDILFGIKNNFSFIAASFIRKKENIKEIRKLLDENSGNNIKIISKIENKEAIDNLDEIIKESDGVMIARGDLGIEIPIEKLPKYQHKMIKSCLNLGKFIITATHLLETMINNPFPTRAESSDVFNSVIQGADCLMLSGETAIGKYPIKTAKLMTSIIKEAENIANHKHKNFSLEGLREEDIEKMMLIKNCIFMGESLKVKAFVIFTKSGLLARLTSGFRPNIPIYAFTNERSSLEYMNILFGINPILLDGYDRNNYNKTLDIAIKYLKDNNIVGKNDSIITIYDTLKNGKDISTIKIINIETW